MPDENFRDLLSGVHVAAIKKGLEQLANGEGVPWDEVREALGIPGSVKRPRGRPRHADPSPDALRHRKHYAKRKAERLRKQEEREQG